MPKAKTLSFAILAIAGWWCGNKVSWQVRADSAAEKDISSILDGMWRDIIERPGHISFTMVDILAGLGRIRMPQECRPCLSLLSFL